MKEDWKTYCLMSGIAYIEEMNKPFRHKVKKGQKEFFCYTSIQFRINSKEIINKWLEITRIWENKLNQQFITEYFDEPRQTKEGRWHIIFQPNWLYHIMKKVGRFPSKHVNQRSLDRLKNWKISGNHKKKEILTEKEQRHILESKKILYKEILKDKVLSAGAFIISFDLEVRGINSGHIDLCMSQKYKDFLEFMLKIAHKWNWSTKDKLSPVNVEYSRKLGIKATDQYNFRVKTSKLSEIYNLAGPVIDPLKDKYLRFHISRSQMYKNKGGSRQTKHIILDSLKNKGMYTSSELQLLSGVGIDVVLDHLHNLENKGLITKQRAGKKYIWRYR